jgi:DNA polymerase-3 subunit delta'
MPVPTLAQLLGQAEVSDFLRGIVRRGRYANAYLFHGPAGVGKSTAALAFARAALCERVLGSAAARDAGPSLFGDAPPPEAGDDACGECASCGKCETLQHPDLKFLFPVTGEERALVDGGGIAAQIEEWRNDPYYTFQYDKAASIRIFQTRELQRELAYHPYEASRRIVVIRDCDRMREDQYSSLLKSIEEPGAATVWVLTSARPSRVPATIRSRCQRVRFAPLSETLIRTCLEGGPGVHPAAARKLAALASGSLARALALREEDVTALRDGAIAALEQALAGRTAETWAAVQKSVGFGPARREALRRQIEFQELWLRDLLRLRYGGPDAVLVNEDIRPRLQQVVDRGIDATEIRRRLLVLEEVLRSIEGNVSADLALFSGVVRAAGHRMGEGAWPGHSTARWDY